MIEIVVALIAVFGVVLPYLLQKNKELNLKIAEQKREAYTNFLKNFTQIAVAVMHDEDVSSNDTDTERMLARDKLLLYASDDVIRAYDAWIRYADTENLDFDREGELVSLLFLAIRKDLLGKTRVTKDMSGEKRTQQWEDSFRRTAESLLPGLIPQTWLSRSKSIHRAT